MTPPSSNDHVQQILVFLSRDQKTLKKFLIEWKAGQENLSESFPKHHYVKYHKMVRPIYLHLDTNSGTILIVLLNPALQECVDIAESNMEEFCKTYPIPQISRLRVARTQTKGRRNIERQNM